MSDPDPYLQEIFYPVFFSAEKMKLAHDKKIMAEALKFGPPDYRNSNKYKPTCN